MNTLWTAIVLAAFSQVSESAPYPTPGDPASGDPTFEPAHIKSDNDRLIPAEVDGVLISMPVREGSRVTAGQVLATIDDRQAQAAVEVAKIGYEAALERANDDVEERYAVAAARVAKTDWERDLAANARIPNSVSDIQILQKKLVLDRSKLQIEKAAKDQVIAAKEAEVKRAELKAAQIVLDRRTINAPFDGEVQQVFRREAEWVNPGEPLLRLVQFDVLKVECFVPAADFDPIELADRRVTVKVKLARGRETTATGRVVFVDQTVVHGSYLVRAEVQNQRLGDYWLIRPGVEGASMTIHVNEAPPQSTVAK